MPRRHITLKYRTFPKSGLGKNHRTIPGSTAKEVGIPTTQDAYPRSYIWRPGKAGPFERLTPGRNLQTDAIRHGIELPMAMLLEKQYPEHDKFFIKHGPGGHNLHTQWAARRGPDYRNFLAQCSGAMADLKKRYGKIRIMGLYWDQGESDGSKAKEYGRNLRALIAALRADTGIPALRFYVRKHLFYHGNKGFAPILDAQIQISKADPNVHLIDLDLGANDKNLKAWAWSLTNAHLSSKAYLELSKRILVRWSVIGQGSSKAQR
jgi:hypothetical protein